MKTRPNMHEATAALDYSPAATGELIVNELQRLALSVANELPGDEIDAVLGRAANVACRGLPKTLVVQHAFFSDCLHVASTAIEADGKVSVDEIDFVFPIAFPMARFLARVRDEYRPYELIAHAEIPDLLAQYAEDSGLFGKRCTDTRWVGLELALCAAERAGDIGAVERYERAMSRTMDEIIALGGNTPPEDAARKELAAILKDRRRGRPRDGGADPRVAAFCDPRGPAVFAAVAHAHQVWERDPLDVDTVHAEARETFERLANRATSPQHDGRGRLLLVLGESGSGKTHLMRAFRAHIHGRGLGQAAYMQLTTASDDYARYALINTISSLDRPFDPPDDERSGLMALSDSLAELPGALESSELAALRDGELRGARALGPLIDRLARRPELEGTHPDLITALLQLQAGDPALRQRILKYLRCEHLNAYDQDLLGDLAPRTDRDAPQRTLEELGCIISRIAGGALVLLVDQLEDVFNLDDAAERFRRAVDVLRHVVDAVPSAIVVISCLDDMFHEVRKALARPVLDRLERDPAPVYLSSRRTQDEIEALVQRRLRYLYDAAGVAFCEDEPLYPLEAADLGALANLRTRDVLDWCHQYRERCIQAAKLVAAHDVAVGVVAPAPKPPAAEDLEPLWNDFVSSFESSPPEDDDALLALLGTAIGACAAESGRSFDYHRTKAGLVINGVPGAPEGVLVSICNKQARGGSLARQIAQLSSASGNRRVIALRSTEWPSSPNTKIVKLLGAFVAGGNRRLVVEDSAWRRIMAFRQFAVEQADRAEFDGWRTREHPISQLRVLRDLLGLDEVCATASTWTPPAPPEDKSGRTLHDTPTDEPAPCPPPSGPTRPESVGLGRRAGLRSEEIALPLQALTTHSGFLGGTGSGKTTIALHLIEQALERGVSAIILDRKGDLCGYADPTWWDEPAADPAAARRKARLRDTLDVDVYTPGEPRGRSLALPVVPAGLGEAPAAERKKLAQQAAAGLAAMMGYGTSQSDRARGVILAKALELLAEVAGDAGLEQVIELLAQADPALVNAIGHLPTRHFSSLIEGLETLRYTYGSLLRGDGEVLDVGGLLTPAEPGRVRLSVISTKFLGDAASIDFWVSRLLIELSRWASRNPSPSLQALALFDEADSYLPATRKPATKEPMEDLLKRARSAGLGIMLATQNPGDLDYKSRDNIATWLVGRIKETRSVDKMKSLLSDYRANVAGRLAGQRTGEFFLLHGGSSTEIKAERSLLQTRQLAEDAIVELAGRRAR
jgi:hypothetical protein